MLEPQQVLYSMTGVACRASDCTACQSNTTPAPLTAVRCLQVNKLQHVPVISSIINLPIVSGLLTSFLPSLILRIFMALLPALLTFMNKLQGMISESSIEFGVVSARLPRTCLRPCWPALPPACSAPA